MAEGSKLTYTGTNGPGGTMTSAVMNNVTELNFDAKSGILRVAYDNGARHADVDLVGRSTITITISAGVLTATVS